MFHFSRWYEVLSMYPKQYLIRNVNGAGALKTNQKRPSASDEVGFYIKLIFFGLVFWLDLDFFLKDENSSPMIKTMIEIKSPSTRYQQQNGGGGQRRVSDPWSQAKVDVTRNDSFHGTPRSVKNRKSSRQKDDGGRSKTCSDIVNNGTINESCHDTDTIRNNLDLNRDKFKNNSSSLSDFTVKIVTRNNGHVDESTTNVETDVCTTKATTSELILTLPQSTPTTSSEMKINVIFAQMLTERLECVSKKFHFVPG